MQSRESIYGYPKRIIKNSTIKNKKINILIENNVVERNKCPGTFAKESLKVIRLVFKKPLYSNFYFHFKTESNIHFLSLSLH